MIDTIRVFNPLAKKGLDLVLEESSLLTTLDLRYLKLDTSNNPLTDQLAIVKNTADTNTSENLLEIGRTSDGVAVTNFGSEICFVNQITETGHAWPINVASGSRGTRINTGFIRADWESYTTNANGRLTLGAFVNDTTERNGVEIVATTSGARVSIGSVASTTGLFSVNIGRGTISGVSTGSILLATNSSHTLSADTSIALMGGNTSTMTAANSIMMTSTFSNVTATGSGAIGNWVKATATDSFVFGSGNDGVTTFLENNVSSSILLGVEANKYAWFQPTKNVFQAISATHIPGVFQGAVSQTGNLTEWQDSSGVKHNWILADGRQSLEFTTDGSLEIGLDIDHDHTGDTSNVALRSQLAYNDSVSNGNTIAGLNAFAVKLGTGNITGVLVGGRYAARNNNASGIITTARAISAFIDNQQTGVITNAYNFYGEAIAAKTGTITNAYGMYISDATVTTGTLTNMYGIYLPNIDNAATLNYAIYTNAGAVRFGDTVTTTSDRIKSTETSTGTATIADDVEIHYCNSASDYVLTSHAHVAGKPVVIINKGAGVVTFTPVSGTVSGETTQLINQYDVFVVYSDGTNFY